MRFVKVGNEEIKLYSIQVSESIAVRQNVMDCQDIKLTAGTQGGGDPAEIKDICG